MKKKIIAVAACAMIACFGAFALTGCGGGDNKAASDTELSGLVDGKVLVVGFDAEYPPYGYLAGKDEEGYEAENGNTYTGFDLDLAQETCFRNGWELKVEPIDWDSKDALIGSGAISCIWNGFTYEGREDQYAWTSPYMNNSQVIVARADKGFKSLDDLAGKIVITQKGSAALTMFEEDQKELAGTFKELQTIADYNSAFMQLESGAVDAVACDYSIAAGQMAAKDGTFALVGDALQNEHYAVGFALGNEALAQTVNDTLLALDKDGYIESLCEKYASQGISYDGWCME